MFIELLNNSCNDCNTYNAQNICGYDLMRRINSEDDHQFSRYIPACKASNRSTVLRAFICIWWKKKPNNPQNLKMGYLLSVTLPNYSGFVVQNIYSTFLIIFGYFCLDFCNTCPTHLSRVFCSVFGGVFVPVNILVK